MIKTFLLKSLASAITALAMTAGSASFAGGEYQLVLADEFEGAALNRSVWTTTMAFIGRTGARYHNPAYLSYSTDDDAIVNAGTLRLRADSIGIEGSDPVGRFEFTQGFVSTHDSFSFTYGYVEVRAKMPGGRGMWPTIWLMPSDHTWPPEFDIAEYFGTPQHLRVGLASGTMTDVRWDDAVFIEPSVETEWHTYSLIWEKGHAVFMLDGEVKLEVWGSQVPDKAMYVILNNAVSSRFGPTGEPDGSTIFPNFLEVDYVRVYQRAETVVVAAP
ncbi:MAG: glycoside hydrolase family 16 protein [Chthoniobacteraceae bacterium]